MARSIVYSLACVFSLVLSSPAALAQSAWGSTRARSWPTSEAFSQASANGPFGRGCAGDFTGDRILDAVVLDGELPVLLPAPDRYSAFRRLPLLAHDIAVLPANQSPSDLDEIVGVGADGLVRYPFDVEAGDFGDPQVIAEGTWDDAQFVRVAQLDGIGGLDFLGVASDGRTVLTRLSQGEGIYTAGPTFTAANDILEIEAIQWNATSARELALRTSAGLEVRNLTGTVTWLAWPHAAPGGALAVLRHRQSAKEALVWIAATEEPGEQLLYVVIEGTCVTTLELGALDVVSTATADADRDLDDDLYLSMRLTHQMAMLENHFDPQNPGGSVFTAGEATLIDLEWPSVEHTDAPSNAAQPIPADFNNDGHVDCVMTVEGETYAGPEPLTIRPYVHVTRGGWVEPEPFHVGLGMSILLQDEPSGEIQLELTFQRPPVLAPPTSVVATHVEVTVWRQASIEDPVETTSVGRYRFPISAWPIAGAVVPLPEVADEESPLVFDTIYKLEIGLVRLSPTGDRLIEVFPTFTGALVASLASLIDVASESDSKPGGDGEFQVQSPPGIDARDDAEIIEKPDVKPFDDDEVPKPPTGQ